MLRGLVGSYMCIRDRAEAVRSNGLILPTFDGVTTFAIQSLCNMNKTQMKCLRRCLISELGVPIFCTEFRIDQALGGEVSLRHI